MSFFVFVFVLFPLRGKKKNLWSRCFLDTVKHFECESNWQVFWSYLLGISAFNVFTVGMFW